jgi:hypothetical protein
MQIGSSHRGAAWAAIASGIVGIAALVFILTAVSDRTSRLGAGTPGAVSVSLRTGHDVGLMLQALFIIPAAFVLHALGQKRSPGVSVVTVAVAVAALLLIALLQLLLIAGVVPTRLDTIYMPPFGVFGVCLIVANSLAWNMLPRGLTSMGIIAGVGLGILGTSAFLFLLFQVLGGEAAMADPRIVKWNRELHMGLAIGTLGGRTMFPIWSILLGHKLLRMGDAA